MSQTYGLTQFVYLDEPLRLGTYSVVKVLSTWLANKDDVESFNKDSRWLLRLRRLR